MKIDSEQIQIDLAKGMKDPEKAKEAIKEIQTQIDELVGALESQNDLLKTQNKDLETATKLLKKLETDKENYRESLVNISTVLFSKKELWKKDEEMAEMVSALSNFLLSKENIEGAAKNGKRNFNN